MDNFFLFEDLLEENNSEKGYIEPDIIKLNKIAKKISPEQAVQEYYLQKERDDQYKNF